MHWVLVIRRDSTAVVVLRIDLIVSEVTVSPPESLPRYKGHCMRTRLKGETLQSGKEMRIAMVGIGST